MYNKIASGSQGNAIIYFDSILVDCGVSFAKIKPYMKGLQVVLLTHIHKDHFNISAIKRLAFERPSLRFGCGAFIKDHLQDISNVDVYEIGESYNYGDFKISPIQLYHDVPNFGYRIFKDGKKIIHATDTYTLKGISAKDYDLYAIEANYDEDRIDDVIKEKRMRGEYAHQQGSKNSHLSMQQAQQFYLNNATGKSQLIALHQSREF